MKFFVSRTSLCSDEQPCLEAFLSTRVIVDERTVDDPKKLHYKADIDDWYARGTHHRVENGHIKRNLTEENAWAVNISSLEDLVAFTKKYGGVVIDKGPDGHLEIEIYDTHRE
jgi:hypothetical protein